MNWVVALYPPAWKRRYGREMRAHLAEEPWRLRTFFDLAAGAIDAWANPDSIPPSDDEEEGEKKMNLLTASRCCGTTDVSKAEALRSAGEMIGITLFLTVLFVTLDKTVGPHWLFDSFLFAAFFVALTISNRRTYFKPYSPRARAWMVTGVCVAWFAFFTVVGLVGEAF